MSKSSKRTLDRERMDVRLKKIRFRIDVILKSIESTERVINGMSSVDSDVLNRFNMLYVSLDEAYREYGEAVYQWFDTIEYTTEGDQ